MKPTYEELEQQVLELSVQLANAESKCRELAAECAGMKQLASEAYDEMVSHHDTDGLYSLDADGEQMDALIRLCDAQATIYDTLVMCETPATDAFLDEVRATALDEFAIAQDEQAKKYYELSPGCSGQNECQYAAGQAWYSAECIRKSAAQLLKGAAL